MKRTFFLPVLLALVIGGCKDRVGPDMGTPVVESIQPAHGTVGTEVRIFGEGFSADAEVQFGDLASPRAELEAGVLFAVAPEGMEPGARYDVRVTNPGGGSHALFSAYEAVSPRAARVNGVSKPTGMKGMTIIVEGDAFGDVQGAARVYFEDAQGQALEAVIADAAEDWTNSFIVTSVPQEIGDTSRIWVETATGASDSIEFRLVTAATFSPSTITWTRTEDLPQALQGLGAAFVPVEDGSDPANYVFVVGGADAAAEPTTAVYRARIQKTGALEAWNESLTPLPAPRAFHATAAATAFTAALDTTTTSAFIYALGGIDADDEVLSSVVFAQADLNGQLGSWQTTRALPMPLHSAGAVVFRGYLYVAGGADAANAARSATYRARIQGDGTLDVWESLGSLPNPSAYSAMISFGPYLYVLGGETATSTPTDPARTTTETAALSSARINLRTGGLREDWSTLASAMGKERSKHSTVFAGGFLFTTSGIYSGQAGSSENVYAEVLSDGSVGTWAGATGSNTIGGVLGYHLYNPAAISFVDAEGNGHVLVLGGADRAQEGQASEAVLYY